MGRSSIWPEQSEEPGPVGDASLWASHASRGSHDFSLFPAGYVGVRHKVSQGKCKVKFAPQGGALILQRDTSFSQQTTRKCSNPVPGSALCGHAGRGKCAAQGHTSGTRPNAHSHYTSHMQISSVCIDCDVGFAVSPILSSVTHLYQETVPALLPFPPELTLSTLFPGTRAKCSQ